MRVDPSPRRPGLVPAILPAILLAVIAATLIVMALRFQALKPALPSPSTSHTVVRPSPDVVVAVQQLARLETVSFHMERVVELSDAQSHLFGMIEARDAILLVAAGDITAGVDLEKVRPADVTTDSATQSVTLRLPAPEIFHAALDSTRTHVVTRDTDRLARRREDLEERARREAESTMRRSAIEAGILRRARTSAEGTVRSLLHSLGFRTVRIEWAEPAAGVEHP